MGYVPQTTLAADDPEEQCWKFYLEGFSGDVIKLWEAIVAAEERLCRQKAAQLERLADILSEHPGTLRHVARHFEEPFTVRAEQHMAEKLRSHAKDMEKPNLHLLGGGFVADWVFGRDRLPLVPYNRVLRAFLKVLERFPLEKRETQISGATKVIQPYPWSPDMKAKLHRVTAGMKFVSDRPPLPYDKTELVDKDHISESTANPPTSRYAGLWKAKADTYRVEEDLDKEDPLGKKSKRKAAAKDEHQPFDSRMRTIATPWSHNSFKESHGFTQPAFIGVQHVPRRKQVGQGLNSAEYILPHAEQEFVWLEEFLDSCAVMAGMEVCWGEKGEKGESVAEWWGRHTDQKYVEPLSTFNMPLGTCEG